MRTAIDINILSAVLTGEVNAAKIGQLLDTAAERGRLVICPVIYAELRAFPHATASFVDTFLDETGIVADWDFDKAIWQLAAERYEKYAIRKRKQKTGELKCLIADFIVGAHALACRCVINSRSAPLPQGLSGLVAESLIAGQ